MKELSYWEAIASSRLQVQRSHDWVQELHEERREYVAVVDYHKGNLSSVRRGLMEAGAYVRVVDDPKLIEGAIGVVVPGVGSFEDAMAYMRSSGQDAAILAAIAKGVPYLGICLGMQLLFEEGNESSDGRSIKGLGILPGPVRKLESGRLKVPHMGWNQLDVEPLGEDCALLRGVGAGENYYFTHSYAVPSSPGASYQMAVTHYASSFASVVARDNVYGCQFHPEKSSNAGAQILRNFVDLVNVRADALRGADVGKEASGVDTLLRAFVNRAKHEEA